MARNLRSQKQNRAKKKDVIDLKASFRRIEQMSFESFMIFQQPLLREALFGCNRHSRVCIGHVVVVVAVVAVVGGGSGGRGCGGNRGGLLLLLLLLIFEL